MTWCPVPAALLAFAVSLGGGHVPAQCTTTAPVSPAGAPIAFDLNEAVEIRWTLMPGAPYYTVCSPPVDGFDLRHAPVIKELLPGPQAEFSTTFLINHARTYKVRVLPGNLPPCDPPSPLDHTNEYAISPVAGATPTPTPVVDPEATPAITLDDYVVVGSASIADQAAWLPPITIRNVGSVPLLLYDIQPYGYAPELIVLPDGFVPCTEIAPGGSLTLPLLAKVDYAELAKCSAISVTMLVISNDPDEPDFGADETGCYASYVRTSFAIVQGSLGLSPAPTPAPYVKPTPCPTPTPVPTPSSTAGNNWNQLALASP